MAIRGGGTVPGRERPRFEWVAEDTEEEEEEEEEGLAKHLGEADGEAGGRWWGNGGREIFDKFNFQSRSSPSSFSTNGIWPFVDKEGEWHFCPNLAIVAHKGIIPRAR